MSGSRDWILHNLLSTETEHDYCICLFLNFTIIDVINRSGRTDPVMYTGTQVWLKIIQMSKLDMPKLWWTIWKERNAPRASSTLKLLSTHASLYCFWV